MTDLASWLLTIAPFAGVYLATAFTPASEMQWQMKNVILSNVGLHALVLLKPDFLKR